MESNILINALNDFKVTCSKNLQNFSRYRCTFFNNHKNQYIFDN